jgi:hypothetical protein
MRANLGLVIPPVIPPSIPSEGYPPALAGRQRDEDCGTPNRVVQLPGR